MEKRRGRYYYKKQWAGGTCQSIYIGQGDGAELLAQLEKQQRLERQAEREAFRSLAAVENATDQEIDAIGKLLFSLVDAHLLLSGFHQHKREWRKRRDSASKTGN